MIFAHPGIIRHWPWAGDKSDFAKSVRSFAKRTVVWLPGFPYLWLISFAVAVLMIVTGGLNTAAIPLVRRIAFWLLLLGWNAFKWQVWFAFTIKRPRDWSRVALIGAVLLNLLLPLEIEIVLASIGLTPSIDAAQVWTLAAIVSIAIFPVIWLVSRRLRGSPTTMALSRAPGGLLDRARVEPEMLIAIEAEDHYCRVRRRDGSNALIHYRFGDALREVAGIDGAQVRRGVWLAASAISGSMRAGRRWLLVLRDGSRVPVSATHLAEIRSRGWLAR